MSVRSAIQSSTCSNSTEYTNANDALNLYALPAEILGETLSMKRLNRSEEESVSTAKMTSSSLTPPSPKYSPEYLV